MLSHRNADSVSTLQAAEMLAKAGELARAESVYRSVLEGQPRNQELLYKLALLACERHDFAGMAELARRALQNNESDPTFHNILGRACRELGQFENSIQAYRRALHLDPGRAELHVSLGIVLNAQGSVGEAITCYRRALRLKPDYPVALHNLANALLAGGDLKKAEETYQRIIALNPDFAEAYFELGNLARWRRDRESALEHYRTAQKLGVKNPDTSIRLGNGLNRLGDLGAAVSAYESAVARRPDSVEAHFHLGGALYDLRQHDAAIAIFLRALALKPDSANGLSNLGLALRGRGRREEAMACFMRAIEREPDLAAAHVNLGVILGDLHRYGEAERSLERALELSPDDPDALACAVLIKRGLHKYADAFQLSDRVLGINPEHAHAQVGRGILLSEVGEAESGIEHFRLALPSVEAEPSVRSALLMAMNYTDPDEPRSIVEEHREFDRCHAAALTTAAPARKSDLHGKLRIGYLSADFRRHSVSFFLEPLLENHDRSRFEVYCYHTNPQKDVVTRRLMACADAWTDCARFSDDELAEHIREDRLDALIDVTGHTEGNRLLVMARRPAPVQLTWLGYPTTTGLSAIDFRVTDWDVDPEGYEVFNAEVPLRLNGSYFCYRPPGDAPAVAKPPCLKNECVTFGSFNNLAKIGEKTIGLWARALRGVPGSRLLMKNKPLGDQMIRDRVIARFALHGIEASRLVMRGWDASAVNHLALYDEVDIALDPFPYNGATTTCESLWMGVPVVSLVGRTHTSRMGLSLLRAAGLPQFAAATEDKYLDICLRLAGDRKELSRLREGLRDMLARSALMDGKAYARNFEAALLRVAA